MSVVALAPECSVIVADAPACAVFVSPLWKIDALAVTLIVLTAASGVMSAAGFVVFKVNACLGGLVKLSVEIVHLS